MPRRPYRPMVEVLDRRDLPSVLAAVEAEAGSGAGVLISRSAASGGQTVLLRAGEVRSLTFPLAQPGLVELVLPYSNDGPPDTLLLGLDGAAAGQVVTRDTRPPGAPPGTGWNTFTAAAPVGPFFLGAGSHTLTIQVLQAGEPGVEVDALQVQDAHAGYLGAIYHHVLARPLDSAGASYASGRLDSGVGHESVVREVWRSVEHRAAQIHEYYERYLHHTLDPDGERFWPGVFARGASETDVQASILASAEYGALHGGTTTGWVMGVYREVLGHDPDPAGLAFWTRLLDGGSATREQAARVILTSEELNQSTLRTFYRTWLGREPGADGEAFWLGELRAGRRDLEGVAEGILAALEYRARVPRWARGVLMDFRALRNRALALAGGPFVAPNPEPIPVLDEPPPGVGREGIGLTFQEELAIQTANVLDQQDAYVKPRPRAALNKKSFDLFTDGDADGAFDRRPYDDARVDYSSPEIQPPIEPAQLPPEARVLSRLIVGHAQPGAGFPQFFDIGADGYVRFNGFAPMTQGASLRLAGHRVFLPGEDFPFVREMYVTILNSQTTNVLALVDSEGFTGAVSINVTPGPRTVLDVDAAWYPRRDLGLTGDPETGFVTFSTMFWKDERDTPADSTDEAHDSDTLVIGFDTNADGQADTYQTQTINNPPPGPVVPTTFPPPAGGRLVFWSLENRDRDPTHYATYASADYAARGSYAIDLRESFVPLELHLLEQHTENEFADNIVVNAAVQGNLRKALTQADSIRVAYQATAFNS